MINEDNIELYLFRYKEGLLDEAETAEVEKALASRPDWQELADLYDPELTLPAGATMPYADFESLRDGGPRAVEKKTIRLGEAVYLRRIPIWKTIGIAASLLVFVTFFVKFLDNMPADGGAIVAEQGTVTLDSVTQPILDTDIVESFMETCESIPTRTVDKTDENLLAEVVEDNFFEELNPETYSAETEPEVEMTKAVDTIKYKIGNGTTRELNDPMDQEVLYADNIIVRKAPDPSESAQPTTRQQLRSIAKRATSIIAGASSNRQQRRQAFGEYIEDQIENNEILSNIIATIE